jgi:hypothetical protein
MIVALLSHVQVVGRNHSDFVVALRQNDSKKPVAFRFAVIYVAFPRNRRPAGKS